MDDYTKVHAMKYLTRTYGKHVSEYVSNNKPVSDYDMKMIFTIQKLRNSYKKYEKGVKTTMLTRYEIDNLNATKNVPIVKMTKEKPLLSLSLLKRKKQMNAVPLTTCWKDLRKTNQVKEFKSMVKIY